MDKKKIKALTLKKTPTYLLNVCASMSEGIKGFQVIGITEPATREMSESK